MSGLLLFAVGTAGLAQRSVSRRQLTGAAMVLGLSYLVMLPISMRLTHAVTAVLLLVVGIVAARWLWPQPAAERLSGILLVLLGLNQFWFVLLGEPVAALQAAIGTVLRTALGLTLLYAALRRSGEAGQRLRDQYLRMTENSHFGVIVIQDGGVSYANPAAYQIYGRPFDRPFPPPWLSRHVSEVDRQRALTRHRALVTGEIEHVKWEGPRTRADGRSMFLRFAAWRIEWNGRPAEQVVVIDDTEHHDSGQALLHQAMHDALTGLPNRVALIGRLGALCAEGHAFGLLLMDVDRLKLFNEAHGPSVGDQVLRALAEALRQAAPGPAELMRLGEDEFALLLPLPLPEGDAEAASLALAGQVPEPRQQPREQPRHP
jgi:PAS domain S-box-containing protein